MTSDPKIRPEDDNETDGTNPTDGADDEHIAIEEPAEPGDPDGQPV